MRGFVLFLVVLFLLQTGYLAASESPSLFYVTNIFIHVFGGLFLSLLVASALRRTLRSPKAGRAIPVLLAVTGAASVLAALALVVLENVRATRWLLNTHILLACLTVLGSFLWFLSRRARAAAVLGTATLAALLLFVLVDRFERRYADRYVIRNPIAAPTVMSEESMGGASGPFFPSAAFTSTGGRIPSDFFMSSDTCERCHADIYAQWRSSAHHFSSFNNQWYRKSIEYMQEVAGTQASKWCAGCHDHAVLFNGVMDDPVQTFIETPEAHTGLGCNSCHAITRVKDTMGNGGFYVEYPPLHDLAVSDNAVLRWLHDFSVRLDPGPHKDVFLKPFHREQTAEFCSSCHKVHLDAPVNSYRWIRGFNEYDNWQASGVSGFGARSFYYPPAPMDCADCHMPRVESDDKGNIDGFVHDHAFLAANTAVPHANLDGEQLRKTIEFLQRNQVTVDIFAAGPATPLASPPDEGLEAEAGKLSSTFGVGEEAAVAVGSGRTAGVRTVGALWAPLGGDNGLTLVRGEEARLDVVVRTRGVGHFFPGGTIDGFEVWLELRATDERGRVVYWSGVAEDGGQGPVHPGSHFYGVRMVDAHGNPIDKRNAWATRAVAWVNLIPPGAADVAHFRVRVPPDCGNELTFEARLNYRKFAQTLTEFSFAGDVLDDAPVTPHFDDRTFVKTHVPMDVSAALREVPDLPIVVMHASEHVATVVDPGRPLSGVRTRSIEDASQASDLLRWNDYGIGLLRQGDLQGARRAFQQVVTLDPGYADGYVNLARVAIREGLLEEAVPALERALAANRDLASAHYFYGVVQKERGEYEAALSRFRRAAEPYPKDRVVRNAIGRVLFLTRRYAEAVVELEKVLEIDPEDLSAHYNLMLAYRGLGRTEESEREQRLYERFKADEDAQMILGPYLRANPEDNRMRQPIHEQLSVSSDVMRREAALRVEGEPNVVMPGEAAAFTERVMDAARERLASGGRAARHLGPTEMREQDARADDGASAGVVR